MGINYNPAVVLDSLELSLDFANIKNYVSGNVATDSIASSAFTFHGDGYWSHSNGTMTFDRTTAPADKYGGGASRTMTGNLTASNFMYNNHTWDIWFRINDRNPGLYGSPSTEGHSTLLLYRGYHGGFFYDATTLYYAMWHGISASNTVCSWTVGTSGAQINQGSWYNLSVTRSGNVFTPYINGNQLGTGGTFVTSNVGIATTNDLCFGKSQNLAANTGSYLYYSKNTVGAVKMYTRALTALEVEQNFSALRGRYGV